MKFLVTLEETIHWLYKVEAKDEEDAKYVVMCENDSCEILKQEGRGIKVIHVTVSVKEET